MLHRRDDPGPAGEAKDRDLKTNEVQSPHIPKKPATGHFGAKLVERYANPIEKIFKCVAPRQQGDMRPSFAAGNLCLKPQPVFQQSAFARIDAQPAV